MAKELIEKIKAEEQFVYCFDPTVTDNEKKLRSEFNKGLHKAIKIIESYKPKVLDQPDSKGWWWVYDDGGFMMILKKNVSCIYSRSWCGYCKYQL